MYNVRTNDTNGGALKNRDIVFLQTMPVHDSHTRCFVTTSFLPAFVQTSVSRAA